MASQSLSILCVRAVLIGLCFILQGDFPASRMINSIPGVDESRKQRLIKVLDIDPEWRMHQVSDGQRRRVQICVGLLRPFKVNNRAKEVPAAVNAIPLTGCLLAAADAYVHQDPCAHTDLLLF